MSTDLKFGGSVSKVQQLLQIRNGEIFLQFYAWRSYDGVKKEGKERKGKGLKLRKRKVTKRSI